MAHSALRSFSLGLACLFALAAEAKGKAKPAAPVAAHPASPAHGVKLFERGKRPSLIAAGLVLPAAATRGKLDRGAAGVAFLNWLAVQKAHFGLRAVNADVLQLRAVHQTKAGFSLRFTERFARLHIEEAELLAIFDKSGALKAVSSSLVPTPALATRAEVNEKDALKAAAKRFGDIDPLKKTGQDGLLLARSGAALVLVWQLPLRDHKSGRAFQAQILAAGPRKGQLLRARPLDAGAAPIEIYDVGPGSGLGPSPAAPPGKLLLDNGTQSDAGKWLEGSSADDWADALAAADNFTKVRDYYATQLGRDGWDGNGAPIVASIRDTTCAGNAFWSWQTSSMHFCHASATVTTMEKATDIVGHELTHGVVGATSKLTYSGESGGLNEHLADMFGSEILHSVSPDADCFVHGAGTSKPDGAPGRRYLDPHHGRYPQPETMDEARAGHWSGGDFLKDRYNPSLLDVHILSGVPSRAIAMAAKEVGWAPLSALLYTVMTARLRADSDFVDYRDQVADECKAMLPAETCAALERGFDAVGIVARTAG